MMTGYTRQLVWTAQRWPSLEHTILRIADGSITVDGAIIAIVDDNPIRLRYLVECDPSWRPLRVTVDVYGQFAVSLSREGDRWFDGDGRERPDLAGCLDVDIALTPLTNTIPIRRLALDHGGSAELDVVYIHPGRTVDVSPQRQRYTRTSIGYRYESGSFQADLLVDAEGIVTDYPGLWKLMSA